MTNDGKNQTGPLEKMMDTVGGLVGQASAATAGSVSATTFVENATIGDLYELEAARIADRRTRSPEIRRMAEMIHADHTTGKHQMRSALRMSAAKLTPPTEMDSRRRTMIDHLERAKDEEFDKVWLDQQKMAHKETLTLFEGFAARGDDAQLRSFARGTIPALREHMAMVNAARA